MCVVQRLLMLESARFIGRVKSRCAVTCEPGVVLHASSFYVQACTHLDDINEGVENSRMQACKHNKYL